MGTLRWSNKTLNGEKPQCGLKHYKSTRHKAVHTTDNKADFTESLRLFHHQNWASRLGHSAHSSAIVTPIAASAMDKRKVPGR